jgi:hypothetical protein
MSFSIDASPLSALERNIGQNHLIAAGCSDMADALPPQLVGIVPVNNARFGDVTKAVEAFFQLEISLLMSRFLEANDWWARRLYASRIMSPSACGG